MVREESFDSFYRATRRQLLHQAFALTGDLPAAQSAVRDAYVGAWQHWRKVSPARRPAGLGAAPRLAARPAPAHRPHLAPQQGHVRGAQGRPRRAVQAARGAAAACCCSSELAGLDLAHAARELGVTRDVAEQQPADRPATRARASARHRRRRRARPVGRAGRPLDSAALPRGPIVRRAGRKRRQGHALVGAVAARPWSLWRPGPSPTSPTPAPPTRPAAGQARRRRPPRPTRPTTRRPRRTCSTGTRSAGSASASVDGRRHQQQHLRRRHQHGVPAEPVRRPGRVRRARAHASRPAASLAAPRVQTVEVSKSATQAEAAFRTTVGWYAGCRVGRLQVLNAYRVDNIGDEATC